MSVSTKKTYNFFISLGIVTLSLGAAFPQDVMHVGFVVLFIAFLLQFFKGNLKYIPTGLEKPLLLFLAAGIISSLFSKSPLYGISYFLEKFWYVIFLFIPVYLFQESELKKFTSFLAWAGIGVAIYTVLQSLIGMNFNLEFNIGELVKFSPPQLRQVFTIGSHPVYEGVGVIGRTPEFAVQLMMMLFFVYGAFRKQWGLFTALLAVVLTFAFQVWTGLFAVPAYLLLSKKRYVPAAVSFVLLVFVFILLPQVSFNTGTLSSIVDAFSDTPARMLVGAGPGQLRETAPSITAGSMYIKVLAEGGLVTFAALIFLIYSYYKRYFSVPPSTKEIWRKIHYGCVLAVTAVLISALILPVPLSPVNAILFWTLAGVGVKTKQGGWTRRLVSQYRRVE